MIRVLFESHSTSLDNEAGLASGHFDVALSAPWRWQPGWSYELDPGKDPWV